MIRKTRFIILIFIFLSILIAGCSSGPSIKELQLSAQDIQWDQTEINANAGQEITLTITNDGTLDHNFNLEEYGIGVEIPPGDSQVVTFLADETGSFEYYCDIPGHLDAGMVGILTINP